MDDLIVFVRIGLYIAAGRLVSGGWLPEDVAPLFTSPQMVETVTGIVLGGATLAWYWLSKARKALRDKSAETRERI